LDKFKYIGRIEDYLNGIDKSNFEVDLTKDLQLQKEYSAYLESMELVDHLAYKELDVRLKDVISKNKGVNQPNIKVIGLLIAFVISAILLFSLFKNKADSSENLKSLTPQLALVPNAELKRSDVNKSNHLSSLLVENNLEEIITTLKTKENLSSWELFLLSYSGVQRQIFTREIIKIIEEKNTSDKSFYNSTHWNYILLLVQNNDLPQARIQLKKEIARENNLSSKAKKLLALIGE